MNARELGFQSAMIKTAGLYANTLPHPDVERWKRIAVATGLGGAALGVSGTLATIALLNKRRHALAAPKAQQPQ